MTQLMYSNKNDILIERDRLDYLPEPQALGRFHRPYPFAEYISDIHSALNRHQIVVTEEEYAVQKDYQRMFGMMVIGQPEEGWQLTLGVRGSHDQSVPRGIALGTRVMVCSNLCFSGELFNGKAKQTIHNEGRILTLIDEAVESIQPARAKQQEAFEGYMLTELTPQKASDLMVEAYRRGGLSGSQLGIAISQYDKPDYQEHREHGDLWRLFNAFTQAIKPRGQGVDMNGIVRKTTIITNLLNEVL